MNNETPFPPIKRIIEVEKKEEGDETYDVHIYEDGSLTIMPDNTWQDVIRWSPEQVASFLNDLGVWVLAKIDQEKAGARVREGWVEMKQKEVLEGKGVPPHHLVPYNELDTINQNIDDYIGVLMVDFTFTELIRLLQPKKEETLKGKENESCH